MGLLATLMLAICAMSTTSCARERIQNPFDKQEMRKQDSLLVVKIIRDGINPSFSSVNELLCFRTQLLESAKEDSVFKTIPETLFRDIADMCIHKYHRVDKKLILKEYNLFLQTQAEPEELPVAELKALPTNTASDSEVTVDTIINGKHWILINEGKTEVK